MISEYDHADVKTSHPQAVCQSLDCDSVIHGAGYVVNKAIYCSRECYERLIAKESREHASTVPIGPFSKQPYHPDTLKKHRQQA